MSASRNDPVKKYAQLYIMKLVREGKIPRAKDLLCVDCKKQAYDYDHPDYSKPESAFPVCRSCHVKRENARGTRINSYRKQRYIGPLMKSGRFFTSQAYHIRERERDIEWRRLELEKLNGK